MIPAPSGNASVATLMLHNSNVEILEKTLKFLFYLFTHVLKVKVQHLSLTGMLKAKGIQFNLVVILW